MRLLANKAAEKAALCSLECKRNWRDQCRRVALTSIDRRRRLRS